MKQITEGVKVRLIGEWRDRYYDLEGNLVHDTGWDHNQIQDTNATLLAMFFYEFLQGAPAISAGPQYLAIGRGLAAWDLTPPTLSRADTTLQDEFFRKIITATDIQYIDPVTKAPSGSETRAVEITLTMGTSEANDTWREFGFFGGDATAAAYSGFMINWVRHGRIDKDSTMTIVRTCRFIFQLET